VATWSYAPYAVFSIASPLLTVAIGYAGIRMLRAPGAPKKA
jgi:NhaC family Na+:H+ antiporter